MRFDGPSLARAWLAVFTAAATDSHAPPALYKTVIIEEYLHHARLWATDRFMLLAATVADLDDEADPSFEEAPERTVIVCDADGLARKLLNHVLTLERRQIADTKIYNFGDIEISIDFDVRVPVGTPNAEQAIEGLEPKYAVLAVPDVERVYLPVVEAPAPDWRPILGAFKPTATRQIVLNPDLVERLGKVRRWTEGPMVWRFGGAERLARVHWPESDPYIEGVVSPRKELGEKKRTEAGDCVACDGPGICFRHAAGVIAASDLGSSLREDESLDLGPGDE